MSMTTCFYIKYLRTINRFPQQLLDFMKLNIDRAVDCDASKFLLHSQKRQEEVSEEKEWKKITWSSSIQAFNHPNCHPFVYLFQLERLLNVKMTWIMSFILYKFATINLCGLGREPRRSRPLFSISIFFWWSTTIISMLTMLSPRCSERNEE